MKHIFLTIFIALLLLAGDKCYCQKNDGLIEKTDTATEDIAVDTAAENIVVDTTLLQTKFNDVDDSIKVYKISKDFAYMRYMDSLLRKRNDLMVDTINGGDLKKGTYKKEKLTNGSAPPPPEKKSSVNLGFLNSPVVKIIFWTLAIGFICYILYKLFLSGGIFKRSRQIENTSAGEQEEEILEPSEYDQLISRAVANKNYRLAVRYWYLQTLQKLSASGAISFAADKTNYEYVRETGNKNYQKDFAALTTNYEYVWYGKFDVNDDVYERLQKDFKFLHQKI